MFSIQDDAFFDQGSAGKATPGTLYIIFADHGSVSFAQNMHIIIAAQIFENSNELPEGVTAVAAWKANQILCTEIVDIVLIAGCTMQALCRDSLQSPGMLAQHTQQLLERREIEKEECCVCFEPFYANFFKFKCTHYVCVSCLGKLQECPLCRCHVLMSPD